MANASSYIDSSQRIEGTISATEDLLLAGHLVGRLDSTHALVVERDGIAVADVSARRIEVHGVVVGDVLATDDRSTEFAPLRDDANALREQCKKVEIKLTSQLNDAAEFFKQSTSDS